MPQESSNFTSNVSNIHQSPSLDNRAEATVPTSEPTQHAAEDREKLLAARRAGFAAGGVLMEGTPLAALADKEIQAYRQKTPDWQQAEEMASALEREATLKRLHLSTQPDAEPISDCSTAQSARKPRLRYQHLSRRRNLRFPGRDC